MKKTLLIIGIAGCLVATGCTVDGYVSGQPADAVYAHPVGCHWNCGHR